MPAGRAAGALVVCRSCAGRCWRAGSSRRSAAPPCGAGCTPMRFGPWRHRSWIFPRDPAFAEQGRAGSWICTQRRWQGQPAGAAGLRAVRRREDQHPGPRTRCHPTLRRGPGRPMYVEHEYERRGAWAYLAAWDVHRAQAVRPLRSQDRASPRSSAWSPRSCARSPTARRAACSGSSTTAPPIAAPARVARLQARWPKLHPRAYPVHASWLNQIEIYFSIVQRKVLTPNDFWTSAALEDRLLHFQARYEATATPFEWTFTWRDLHRLLAKLAGRRDSRPRDGRRNTSP